MRRTTQLLLVSFILDSALAGVCNQTTGAACVLGTCSGQNQECVGTIFGIGGNCYCKDTCFVNGACSATENAFCTFDTTTDCSSISNSQCGYGAARCAPCSDQHCAGRSAIYSNRQVAEFVACPITDSSSGGDTWINTNGWGLANWPICGGEGSPWFGSSWHGVDGCDNNLLVTAL